MAAAWGGVGASEGVLSRLAALPSNQATPKSDRERANTPNRKIKFKIIRNRLIAGQGRERKKNKHRVEPVANTQKTLKNKGSSSLSASLPPLHNGSTSVFFFLSISTTTHLHSFPRNEFSNRYFP